MKSTELEVQTNEMMERFIAIEIVDNNTYRSAAEFLVRVKEMRGKIAEAYDSIIATAYASHKEACRKKKAAEAPFVIMEQTLTPKIKEFLRNEEAKRQKEQEELNRKIKEQAEADRLAAAVDLESQGRGEEAEDVLSRDHVPVATLASNVPSVDGFRKPRGVWKFRVVDETQVPDQYWMLNESAIGSVVRSTKGKLSIPGIVAFEE